MTFLRRMRSIALLGLLLLTVASLVVTFWGLGVLHDNALIINLAGHQRMLIQTMALEVSESQSSVNPTYHQALPQIAAAFEQTLNALAFGGAAPYTDGTTVTLLPTRETAIIAQLESVRATWNEMRPALNVAVARPDRFSETCQVCLKSARVAAAATVKRLAPILLAQMDEAVRLYESEARRQVTFVQTVEFAILTTVVALLLIIFVVSERWVLAPIARLRDATRRIGAGDLDTPISITGPREIEQLARGLDDMRQSLAGSRVKSEHWAGELESRVQARAREIAALGTVAQATNRHTEIEPLLTEVLPLLTEITGASAAWVLLLDPRVQYPVVVDPVGGSDFALAAAHNLPPALEADDRRAMRWQGCICQRKLLAGELTAAVNILECERIKSARGDTRGLRYHAAVPLRAGARSGGQVLGNLNLGAPADHLFGDDELRVLNAIGDQIGAAIERARLYEQVKAQRLEEQAALLHLSQALLGQIEAQAVMDAAVRVAAKALKVEAAALALSEIPVGIDAEDSSFSWRSGIGVPPELLQPAVPDAGASVGSGIFDLRLDLSTALGDAIRTRAPVVIPDKTRETRLESALAPAPTPVDLPWTTQMGIASPTGSLTWLVAPMFVGEEAIGGLALGSRTARAWSDDEVRLLSLITNQTAVALEKARLFEATRRQLEELRVLYSIATIGVEATGVDALLERAVQIIGDTLHQDYFGIGLVDEATGVLRVHRSTRTARDEHLTIPLGQGAAGRVIATGQPMRIPDVSREPAYLAVNPDTRSELCVPLRVGAGGARVIGLINIESTRLDAFSASDERLMMTVAGQLATALEKARLFHSEQRGREAAAALIDITQVASSSLELVQVLKQITQRTAQACHANRCSIFLLDVKDPVADAGASVGYSEIPVGVKDPVGAVGREEYLKPVMSQFADGHAEPTQWQAFKTAAADPLDAVPLFRTAIRERRPALLDDPTRTDLVPPRWTQPFDIQKLLVVPLVSYDQAIGLMVLDHSQAACVFTPEQIDLALTIGGQVAASIKNAQLYAQTQQRLDELRLLHQASQALNAELTLEPVLNAVADHLIAALDVQSCTISSWDVARDEIVTLLDRDPEPRALQADAGASVRYVGSRFRIQDFPYYTILLHEGRSYVMRRDAPNLDEALCHLLDTFLWRTLLAVPLVTKGQVIGIVEMGERRRERDFSADEIRLAESLAGQAAAAMGNARLYAQAEKHADQLLALREASRALTSDLHLDAVLQTLTETAQRLANARYAALAVLDAEGRPAQFLTVGLDAAARAQIGAPPQGRGLLGALLRDGTSRRENIPIRSADLTRDPRAVGFPPHHPPMKTFMGVPIVARGKVLGSLYLTDKMDAQPFTQEDENLVVGLAADAAIAIENARLFGQVQQLARTDDVTGLHNRRHLLELAGREFERARRYSRPLSAIMLDIDRFKRVNDTYGHAIGDQVLRAVATRCQTSLRDIDLFGRYGGEEFLVILPENTGEATCNAAERLRQSIAATPIDTTAGPVAVTLSLGVADCTEDCPNLSTLIARADEAMYVAKSAGRNRVA